MATKTIYIPDDLKTEIDHFERENWSAIAQDAFKDHLISLKRRLDRDGEYKMDDVIERLRLSKARAIKADQEEGEAAGLEWAAKYAEYRELRSLSRTAWDYVEDKLGVLKNIGDPDDGLTMGEFCEQWFGTETAPQPEFLEGFVAGALQVANEVEGKI